MYSTVDNLGHHICAGFSLAANPNVSSHVCKHIDLADRDIRRPEKRSSEITCAQAMTMICLATPLFL